MRPDSAQGAPPAPDQRSSGPTRESPCARSSQSRKAAAGQQNSSGPGSGSRSFPACRWSHRSDWGLPRPTSTEAYPPPNSSVPLLSHSRASHRSREGLLLAVPALGPILTCQESSRSRPQKARLSTHLRSRSRLQAWLVEHVNADSARFPPTIREQCIETHSRRAGTSAVHSSQQAAPVHSKLIPTAAPDPRPRTPDPRPQTPDPRPQTPNPTSPHAR